MKRLAISSIFILFCWRNYYSFHHINMTTHITRNIKKIIIQRRDNSSHIRTSKIGCNSILHQSFFQNNRFCCIKCNKFKSIHNCISEYIRHLPRREPAKTFFFYHCFYTGKHVWVMVSLFLTFNSFLKF